LFGERESPGQDPAADRNPLLTSLEGADGLIDRLHPRKALWHGRLAVQNGMRLIVVINGLEDPDDRASEAKKMLEWGFRNSKPGHWFAPQAAGPATPRYLAARAARSTRAPSRFR